MWLIYNTACKTELPFKLAVTVFGPILLTERTYNFQFLNVYYAQGVETRGQSVGFSCFHNGLHY